MFDCQHQGNKWKAVRSCMHEILQGRHQRTKSTQSCHKCYGNAYSQPIQTTSAGPLTVSLQFSLCLPFPQPSASLRSLFSSFLTISQSLSLPIHLSVGGLHEKVVHSLKSSHHSSSPMQSTFPVLCFLSHRLSALLIFFFVFSSSPPLPFISSCSTSLLTKLYNHFLRLFLSLHLFSLSISSVVSSSPLIQ